MKLGTRCLLMIWMAGSLFAQNPVANPKIPHTNPFKHIVLIIQENRTPDTLFQTLLTYPGLNAANYDIASSGLALVNGQDETIQLTPWQLPTDYDLEHSHEAFEIMWNNGKMDGANLVPDTCQPNSPDCQNKGMGQFLSYKYVEASEIQPYLQLAAQYGWANYMFQTNQGPSFGAHQILFSATTAQTAEDDAEGDFVSGVPGSPPKQGYIGADDTGCLAPLDEVNAAITPQSAPNEFVITNDPLGTFCFQHDTMATLLDGAQLSWKYYAADSPNNPYPNDPEEKGYNQQGTMYNGANTAYDICQPDYTQNPPVCTSPEWTNNIDLNPADVLTDISSCNLPAVAWVTPIGPNSDHPGESNSFGGPSWAASIVNAVGAATNCDKGAGYWSDTAILLVWDDWGGWYDHVAPTILPGNQGDYELGFRVPLVVVSAYTPQAYVSNLHQDFGSIIRFMEGVFDFPEGSLGFSDARTNTDLGDFFNFNKQPRKFLQISQPLSSGFFIEEHKINHEPPDTY